MEIMAAGNQHAFATAPSVVPTEQLPQQREVIQAVRAINQAELLGQDNELTFSVDRDTHRLVVKIVNPATKEVLRQVPAEYVLRLAKDLEGKED